MGPEKFLVKLRIPTPLGFPRYQGSEQFCYSCWIIRVISFPLETGSCLVSAILRAAETTGTRGYVRRVNDPGILLAITRPAGINMHNTHWGNLKV